MNKEIVAFVVPNWDVESAYYHFNISVNNVTEDDDFEEFYADTVNDSELFDIIQELNFISREGNVKVNVFANYHGNKQLTNFYNELIDIFEDENFHMEYEWG